MSNEIKPNKDWYELHKNLNEEDLAFCEKSFKIQNNYLDKKKIIYLVIDNRIVKVFLESSRILGSRTPEMANKDIDAIEIFHFEEEKEGGYFMQIGLIYPLNFVKSLNQIFFTEKEARDYLLPIIEELEEKIKQFRNNENTSH